MVPDTDPSRIRRWAATPVLEQVQDQIRIEIEVMLAAVTVLESRPRWQPDFAPEWTRNPVTRVRYTPKCGTWTLEWLDRHGVAQLRPPAAGPFASTLGWRSTRPRGAAAFGALVGPGSGRYRFRYS